MARFGRGLGRLGGGFASTAEGMAAYRAKYPFAPGYIAVTNISDQTLVAGEQANLGGRMVTVLRDIPPGGSGIAF
jgi:hypothetical protein